MFSFVEIQKAVENLRLTLEKELTGLHEQLKAQSRDLYERVEDVCR